jgi:diguanylate cyclase (GGDEF)-like protein
MTLKRFSLFLLSSLFVAICCLLASIYYFFYLPGIKAEILDQQQQEFNLLHSALSLSKNSLTTLCYDYAVWDELVEFVKKPTDEFVQSNMPDNAFEAANIDAVLLTDINNQLVWGFQHESLLNSRQSLVNLITQGDTALVKILPTSAEIALHKVSSRSGYLVLDGQLIYFSNTTILPSAAVGEIVGSLTMFRLLDSDLIKDISQLSLIDFSIQPTTKTTNTSDDFFSFQQIETISPSHTWLIGNKFDDEVVLVTLNHKKVSLPRLDWLSVMLLMIAAVLIISLSLMMLSKWLISPLIQFNQNINDSSNDGLMSKMRSNHFIDEIDSISNSFNQLLQKFNAQQNYLETLTVQDALTCITNRRGLEAFAKDIVLGWHKEQKGFSAMMIDVDHFKAFNDQYGHLEGDNALVAVAKSLAEQVSTYEAIVSRYGGEEFCIIFSECDPNIIRPIAEKICRAIEQLHMPNKIGNRQWVTVSIGVLVVNGEVSNATQYSFSDVLQQADEQLYLAKQAGRNTVKLQCFTQ